MRTLGKTLRELREKQNLSQKELSERLGISNAVLSRYELDDRKPDYDTLERIADYFGVTTDYLLGRSDIKRYDDTNEMKVDPAVRSLAREIQSLESGDKELLQSLIHTMRNRGKNTLNE